MTNQKKTKILVLSSANPTRAYSGIKYLFQELRRREYDVEVWSLVPKSQKREYEKWGEGAKSFLFNIFGNIPKVRRLFVIIQAFILALNYRNQCIICHELTFYKLCAYVKKMFPKTIMIHYCTELFDEKSPKHFLKYLKYYERHVNIPDLVIECDEMRRIYRKEKYSILKPTVTIYNTIPEDEIKKNLKISKKKHSIPIITYTGAAYGHRQLDLIINAVKKIKNPFILKLFVYGPQHAIDKLDELCLTQLGSGKYVIVQDTPREELFDKVINSDIGIVYYNPSLSIGNKYASPTKFFEYIAMGIPVVSSNNASLVKLIDEFNLGLYVKDQSVDALYYCINLLLDNPTLRSDISQNEKKAFHESLCYEIQTKNAFQQIEYLIRKR